MAFCVRFRPLAAVGITLDEPWLTAKPAHSHPQRQTSPVLCVVAYRSNFEAIHCPQAIATTNIRIDGDIDASAAIAGPGHSPASPQPIPNITLPAIRRVSISDLSGTTNLSANIGFALFITNGNPMPVTATAAIITNSKVASQLPKRSRNPTTRVGLIISDTHNPRTKIIPETNAARSDLMQSHVGQDIQSQWPLP